MSDVFLDARDLRKTYTTLHREVEVLRGVDLSVAAGEVVAITGGSGSGKSTLLNILGSLDRPDQGSIVWGDQSILDLPDRELSRRRNRQVGFVFQSHHLLGDFTALENVMMPARVTGGRGGAARQRATELLARVGLEGRLEHRPGELSGGEQQRVAVARALMNEPQLLLADEPGGNLDRARAEELHGILLALGRDAGLAVVIVTHDESLANRAQRWVHLSDGTLHERTGGASSSERP